MPTVNLASLRSPEAADRVVPPRGGARCSWPRVLVCWAAALLCAWPVWADDVGGEREPALALDLASKCGACATALRAGRWSDAVAAIEAWSVEDLRGPERAERAFVLGWARVHAGLAVGHASLVEAFDHASVAPEAWKALVAGELLAANGQDQGALARLALIPDDHPLGPRARAVEAERLRALGRTQEASDRWLRIASRPDPAPGNAVALRALSERRGLGSERALPFLTRLWAHYPTREEGRWATQILGSRYSEWAPSTELQIARAQALMGQGAWNDVIGMTDTLAREVQPATAQGCEVAYLRARALYKRNRLSDMLAFLQGIGKWCEAGQGEALPGHKVLYLQGMAANRLKRHEDAAGFYEAIARRHADTSYADDGLTRAGLARLEAGDQPGALTLWREALDRFPDGDTVPEAAFRLGFTLWELGEAPEASAVMARLAGLDPSLDEVHVLAARYWVARWLAWPDVAGTRTVDPAALSEAASQLARLASEAPHHFYGAMAWARLAELSPPIAAGVVAARSEGPPDLSVWELRAAWVEDPAVKEGIGLMAVGLVREGVARLGEGPEPTTEELAWSARWQSAAGDPVGAHERMHDRLRAVSAVSLGPSRDRILAVALPDLYGAEIRAAVDGLSVDPRFFHAIVREESRFRSDARSWAGAQGLAQLMPATARDVSRRSGRPARDLSDPEQNLGLGAWYLHHLLQRFSSRPQLVMAAYNAGPGNTRGWVKERGGVPLDVFVERIPFRETRGYVKRVSSTWQAYRWVWDHQGPPFLDLSSLAEPVTLGEADQTE